MKSDQIQLFVLIGATSAAAVGFVFSTALASIFFVYLLKTIFAFIVQAIAFLCELVVAVVAAVTSGQFYRTSYIYLVHLSL